MKLLNALAINQGDKIESSLGSGWRNARMFILSNAIANSSCNFYAVLETEKAAFLLEIID